jgi:hypothetical protein
MRARQASFKVNGSLPWGPYMVRDNFDKTLISAIEEGLCPLGESSKQAIFFHLEKSFDIKKENIPTKLREFKEALEGIFGPGAQIIEKSITKCLQNKLGLQVENTDNVDILGCVDIAKRQVTRG